MVVAAVVSTSRRGEAPEAETRAPAVVEVRVDSLGAVDLRGNRANPSNVNYCPYASRRDGNGADATTVRSPNRRTNAEARSHLRRPCVSTKQILLPFRSVFEAAKEVLRDI